MFDTLRSFTDRLLGRGSAAITVPVMDGAFKPNRTLDEAERLVELPGIDDLASAGATLWISAGRALLRLEPDGPVEVRTFDADITALGASASGQLAVAVGGQQILLFGAGAMAHAPVAVLTSLAGQPLRCVNALAFEGGQRVLFTEGSVQYPTDQWCRDLMTLGHSGRVGLWTPNGGAAQVLADGLGYAYGVLPVADGVLVSESWRHRLQCLDAGPTHGARSVLAELPGYPSRMSEASGGGFWLTCFVCRTQLVEFVLREPAYRQRMIAEIDPRHWIAPALSSGHSFLEPLQGAGVKQMGVMKPWAPPRSYGLVLRVGQDGRVLRSLHSQVDGVHHGITAVTEHHGALYLASRGSGRLLRVPLQAEGAAS